MLTVYCKNKASVYDSSKRVGNRRLNDKKCSLKKHRPQFDDEARHCLVHWGYVWFIFCDTKFVFTILCLFQLTALFWIKMTEPLLINFLCD